MAKHEFCVYLVVVRLKTAVVADYRYPQNVKEVRFLEKLSEPTYGRQVRIGQD
jgi:hypothetical protein